VCLAEPARRRGLVGAGWAGRRHCLRGGKFWAASLVPDHFVTFGRLFVVFVRRFVKYYLMQPSLFSNL
jgi:hypothetical protein